MFGKSFSYYVMHDGEDGFIKLTASRFSENEWEHLTDILDFPATIGGSQESVEEMATITISAFIQQRAKPFYAGAIGPNDGEYAVPS